MNLGYKIMNLDKQQKRKKPPLNTRRCAGHTDAEGNNLLYGLNDLCEKYIKPDFTMLELGCGKGASTGLFAYYAKIIHTIDGKEEPACLRNIHNVIYHSGTFRRKIPKIQLLYPEKIDFVYIDGAHSYDAVCKDIDMALPLIKDSGYIGGHDYWEKSWCGVIEAVRDKLGEPLDVFSDHSWIIKVSDIK